MRFLLSTNGKIINTSSYIPVSVASVDEPTLVEGAGLTKKKSNAFSNFKISTNHESAKEKANKFINLKL